MERGASLQHHGGGAGHRGRDPAQHDHEEEDEGEEEPEQDEINFRVKATIPVSLEPLC